MFTITHWFVRDYKTDIISIVLGIIVYKLSKTCIEILSLPPGPTPLPFLGNILSFRDKCHWTHVLKRMTRVYGPVITVWLGHKPYIIISDIDIAKETFEKNEFAGRPDSYFGNQFSNEQYSDIIFTDFGHTWEALRRTAYLAVQKHTTYERLNYIASDCVERTVKLIIDKEGIDKPFVPFDYTYHLYLNLLAANCFGKSYNIEDKEYKQIKYFLKDFEEEVGIRLMLLETSSIFRSVFRGLVRKQKQLVKDTLALVRNIFMSHYETYEESVNTSFCDSLISAKIKALKEDKESASYLTDTNLAMTSLDLLVAGVDASHRTFNWFLLLLAYYPDIQEKLRQEIELKVGNKVPTLGDREECNYVMAFISESLRFSNGIALLGSFHKAVVRSTIGNYTVPEGTGVFVFHSNILTDEKYWPNPDQFTPERFIENGKYCWTQPKQFIPFGIGRRVCLGRKLANINFFLVLVRFLQLTQNYNIVLISDSGLDADPNIAITYSPKKYQISFTKKFN